MIKTTKADIKQMLLNEVSNIERQQDNNKIRSKPINGSRKG